LERSAIILAGGFSTRLGQDKGLIQLANKPLVRHVLDKASGLADERLVIVSSKVQAEKYTYALGGDADVFVDDAKVRCPLAGAATGFEHACGKYSFLLPCDTPFILEAILHLLLELCMNRNAAIPRWPNCCIEPLQAVYSTKPALDAAKNALSSGRLNLQAMIDRLQRVRYVSTLVLAQLDPQLKTFININDPLDLKKAEAMLRRQ
jgi:molybdopterin-guanine dinucleotide biosynthesis protein A